MVGLAFLRPAVPAARVNALGVFLAVLWLLVLAVGPYLDDRPWRRAAPVRARVPAGLPYGAAGPDTSAASDAPTAQLACPPATRRGRR